MALQVTVEKGEFYNYRVKLIGSLDTESVGQFDKALAEPLADPDMHAIAIDLHDLKFISSLGLGSLAKARKNVQGKGGVFVVSGAQPHIARVFEIVRMLPKEIVFANREEADAYLMDIQKKILDKKNPAT